MSKVRKVSGVYKIENETNGKIYIGSSKDIGRRFRAHMKNLEANKHHSIKLQRAYNKTKDKSVFVLHLIEEVENCDDLLKIEQDYIIKYNCLEKGYNCTLPLDSSKARKKVNKKKRDDSIEEYFREYEELIGIMGESYKGIIRKKPKLKMKKINELFKYFIDNFNADTHHCRLFQVNSTKEYLQVSDKYNRIVGIYTHVKGYIELHEQYTASAKELYNK